MNSRFPPYDKFKMQEKFLTEGQENPDPNFEIKTCNFNQQQQHGNYVGHPQAALGFVWNYPSNASGGCLDTFDGPENPLDIAFWPKKMVVASPFV